MARAERPLKRPRSRTRTAAASLFRKPGRTAIHAALDNPTERKRSEREILEAIELEQRRIGQDLHDELCQHLAGIKFKSALLEQKLEHKAPAEARDAKAIECLINQAIERTRGLASGLNPVKLEAGGLMSTLRDLAASIESSFHVNCSCRFPRPVRVRDQATAVHLYRIAQEAIHNAIRHGKAKKVWMALKARHGRVTLTVKDNGRGFPRRIRNKTGMGLHNMRSRARMIGASLEIQRGGQGGTTVTCWLRGRHRLSV